MKQISFTQCLRIPQSEGLLVHADVTKLRYEDYAHVSTTLCSTALYFALQGPSENGKLRLSIDPLVDAHVLRSSSPVQQCLVEYYWRVSSAEGANALEAVSKPVQTRTTRFGSQIIRAQVDLVEQSSPPTIRSSLAITVGCKAARQDDEIKPADWEGIDTRLLREADQCTGAEDVVNALPSATDPRLVEQEDEDYGQHASDTSSIAPLNRGEPDNLRPQGGFLGWTQVVVMHLVNFNTFGYMLSFGIFQEYYTRNLNMDSSNVSWVGTIELFFVYFMGAFSGRAVDAGYHYVILAIGLFLQVLGVFMTSIATEYWQLFLAQGICQGIGNGLLFSPAIAHISAYFPADRRAFPISCVACGGGTGGLVYPAIAQTLLTRLGFAWTVRVMGFILLFNAILILIFVRPRTHTVNRGALFDWRAFREAPYALFSCGMFMSFWGLYFAYYYVRPFGRDILFLSREESFSLLLLINGAGIPGRLLPALLSDGLLGPVNVIVVITLCAGALVFAWIPVANAVGMYIWVSFYGFFGGAAQTLFQTSCSSFTPDSDKLNSRIGMVFTIVSLACLTGPPLAGRLLEMCDGRYLVAQLFGGSVIVLGSIFLLAARFAKTGPRILIRC